MKTDKMTEKKTKGNLIEKCELIFNTLNHVFIGFVAIYMTWYSLSRHLTKVPLHAWLCTIGYQLLMSEAIMCFYSGNSVTTSYSTIAKRYIHLVLQIMGSGLGLGGALYIIVNTTGEHFTSTHGILGLTATILLGINLLGGFCAFFSIRLRHIMKPIVSKTFHIFFGLSGYLIGMVALYYGIMKLQRSVDLTFVTMMAILSLFTIVLTLIGTLKSMYRNITGMFIEG